MIWTCSVWRRGVSMVASFGQSLSFIYYYCFMISVRSEGDTRRERERERERMREKRERAVGYLSSSHERLQEWT